MFPGVHDPAGPAVAFRMCHALLFPAEMPTDKGCLVGASCTPSSPSWGRRLKPVHMGEGLHHPVPQNPSCRLPPISQPWTQLTWKLQHPGDPRMPWGKHPRCAWLSPQLQRQSQDRGWRQWCYRWGILTLGRAARPDPDCRQASTFPREQDPAQLCCSHGAQQLSRPAGRICSRGQRETTALIRGEGKAFLPPTPIPWGCCPPSSPPPALGGCRPGRGVQRGCHLGNCKAQNSPRARAATALKLPFP